jgi:hypothetical protein
MHRVSELHPGELCADIAPRRLLNFSAATALTSIEIEAKVAAAMIIENFFMVASNPEDSAIHDFFPQDFMHI